MNAPIAAAELVTRRANLPADPIMQGNIKVNSLLKKAQRKADAANLDKVLASAPRKPPMRDGAPVRPPERRITPGQIEARKFRKREIRIEIDQGFFLGSGFRGIADTRYR